MGILADSDYCVVIMYILSIAAAISDECLPLPITPVLVGHDHEWLSVSPLSLPAWVSQMCFLPRLLSRFFKAILVRI